MACASTKSNVAPPVRDAPAPPRTEPASWPTTDFHGVEQPVDVGNGCAVGLFGRSGSGTSSRGGRRFAIGDVHEPVNQIGGGAEASGLNLAQRTHIDSRIENQCPRDIRNRAVARCPSPRSVTGCSPSFPLRFRRHTGMLRPAESREGRPCRYCTVSWPFSVRSTNWLIEARKGNRGSIDQKVLTAAAKLLPNSTGFGEAGWYRELEQFFNREGIRNPAEPRVVFPPWMPRPRSSPTFRTTGNSL